MAPVWLIPARAPAADPPTYWARTGLCGVICRAVSMNRWPSRIASMYRMIASALFVFAQIFHGFDEVDIRFVAGADGLAQADAPFRR